MKVHIAMPPIDSRSFHRISQALVTHAPDGVAFVASEDTADLVVFLVIGYPETVAGVERVVAKGKRYAIVQACLRSTQEPSTEKWLPLWSGAACVWSYYDLKAALLEDLDRGEIGGREKKHWSQTNFYHAPLGVDSAVFRPADVRKRFTMATSGYVPETEGVLEAMEAARRVGGSVFHLGPTDARYGVYVSSALGISDELLAKRYAECRYVAGLRRCEGFEMPAAEGLLCGARPIMFDAPHYRQWFEPWAEFIPEGDFETVTTAIEQLFRSPARLVTDSEREAAAARFHWPTIIAGFWERIVPKAPRVDGPKPRLLWVGDAVSTSGFARCTHKTLDAFVDTWNVAVLGLNYQGDPHRYPYAIYPCWPGGDGFGVNRLPDLVERLKPDVVVVQNDPWNIEQYRAVVPTTVPMMGAIAVDGKNCRGSELNGLDLAIFWTRFALDEARAGGFTGAGAVVPLGVDLDIYQPTPRAEARQQLAFTDVVDPGSFVVGYVGRNQFRKRLDLLIAYFAEWVSTRHVRDAHLFLYVGPTTDNAYDLPQLAKYYLPQSAEKAKNRNRIIIYTPEAIYGMSERMMAGLYSCFDVMLATTQGEGWGLPMMEGMACGIPQIVPAWSGLAEWTEDAALHVPCPTTIATANRINTIGGVPDRVATINALDRLYQDRGLREELSRRGRALVERPCYRWSNIGAAFKAAVENRLAEMKAAPTMTEAVPA